MNVGVARSAPTRQAVAALTAHELRMAARRGENVLVTLVIPPAVLVFFAMVGGGAAGTVDRLLAGTLALGIIATGFVSLGIATAYERQYGVLKRLGGAPVARGAVVLSRILAVLALEAIQAVTLVAIAWLALGWRPGSGGSVLLVLAGVGLGTAAFAGLGLAMAGRLRAEATLAVANSAFVAAILLGGLLVPPGRLPAPLGAIASILPAAPLAEVLAAGLGAPDAPSALLPALGLLAAWAAAGVLLAIREFRWD